MIKQTFENFEQNIVEQTKKIQVIYIAELVTCNSGHSVVTYFEVSHVWNVFHQLRDLS